MDLTSSSPLLISGYLGTSGLPLNGLLDDFRVYRRALSALEVAEIDLPPDIFADGFEEVPVLD